MRVRQASAVVMAGGQGARLGALTETLPKPMLPVGGRPILEWIVRHLAAEGIRDVTLALGFRAEVIRDHFGDGSRWGARIECVLEEEPLGTAGALARITPRVPGPILVMNGDILADLSFAEMLDFHAGRGAVLTLGMVRHAQQVPFGMVTREGERLTGIVEKPDLHVDVGAGIYVISPEALRLVPRDRRADFPELVQRILASGGKAFAYPVPGFWRDVGRTEDYQAVAQDPGVAAKLSRWDPGAKA